MAVRHGTESCCVVVKELDELTPVESIRRIITRSSGLLLGKKTTPQYWPVKATVVGKTRQQGTSQWPLLREWMEREDRVPARGENNSNKVQASNTFKRGSGKIKQ